MAKGYKTGGREIGTPNKTTSELRRVLKHMIDDELKNLQDNINELDPKERIELLIKLLPYVMPKVQTVSARDGEPIGTDWINEF
tara:strand:+ start:143 stop:394 length:252 start_codon:yes stop_codon:yes gene_type:complete